VPDDPASQELLGRSADERLLDVDAALLPDSIVRPAAPPPRPGRSPLVGFGVALGALTLVGGIALALLGVVELFSGSAVTGVAELWGGILLVATHWGWVHIAAWTSDKLKDRQGHVLELDRQRWLQSIEPYARYEVTTHVNDDGSIRIETICHRPLPAGSDRFTFERDPVARETHSSEEPAAAIAERAELLRREAATRTAAARERYQSMVEAHELAQIAGRDEQEQMAVRRAASEALSEQLNTKLRDPPLVE
jgi:hypothetical protein